MHAAEDKRVNTGQVSAAESSVRLWELWRCGGYHRGRGWPCISFYCNLRSPHHSTIHNGTGAHDGKVVTNLAVHMLATSWTLWELRSSPGVEYAESFHPIGQFGTLEKFWAYWSRLPRLSALFSDGVSSTMRNGVRRSWKGRPAAAGLPPPQDPSEKQEDDVVVLVDGFAVFREGVQPAWEDPSNCAGGEWNCRKGGAAWAGTVPSATCPLRSVDPPFLSR